MRRRSPAGRSQLALDTALRRASALHGSLPWRGILPLPDGTVGQPDRQVIAFHYSGIAAGDAEAPAELADNPLNFGLAVPPSMPSSPGPDFAMAPRHPRVDADFFAFARLAQVDAYLEEVQQWMSEQLGDGEEMADVNEVEGLE